MWYILSVSYFLILATMVLTPFAMPFLLRWKGYTTSLLLSSFLSFITCVLLVSLLAYLPHLYAELRLNYLGFNFDGWSDEERVRNIPPALRDESTRLYQSTLGIGWTLQAIIGAVLLIPYQIVASGLVFMVSKSKR
jgi:hypothetical protein